MRFGFFPTEGGASFEGPVRQAQTAETKGFDSVWVCEHHQSQENYWPAPFTRLASLATITDRLRLVTAVVVTPLHHPVRLAEQALTLDQISEGRLDLGVAAGYVPAEFDGFDVPIEERFPRFVEGLRLFDRYLSADGPFSFDGRYWSLEDWTPIPPSHQQPRPPIYVGGWGDKALERSVRFGDGWMPGGTADLGALAKRFDRFKAVADELGVNPADLDCPLMREVAIADTSREAMELGHTYLHRAYTDEYGTEAWSHPLIDQSMAADFEALAADRFLVGTPDEIIEQVERFHRRLGVDRIGCRFHFPGMDDELVRQQINLFGSEVIPSF